MCFSIECLLSLSQARLRGIVGFTGAALAGLLALLFYRSYCSCLGYDYLVDGGVHLSPDVQGQVEQQEQEVSHRERGQEQGGVVTRVTLPSGIKTTTVHSILFHMKKRTSLEYSSQSLRK